MKVEIKTAYIDQKGNGHSTGTVNGKEFHIAGSEGYCDDQLDNLTDEEFDAIFAEIEKLDIPYVEVK